MKNLIFASMIAIGSVAAFIGPTQAASIVIEGDGGIYSPDYADQYSPDNGEVYVRHYHSRDYDNNYGDSQYGDMQYGDRQYRHHRHHCRTEIIEHWRHHHRVIERVRMCG